MSKPEVIKNDPARPTNAPESSANLDKAKDAKRELDDAEVGAIQAGQNGHNPPPPTTTTVTTP